MALKFHNTLSRKTEDFTPIKDNFVGVYTCGPTVYNYAHIGNLRSFVFADILKRTLEYFDYSVNHVMNITDVDDKTIKGSQASGEDLKTFTRRFEDAFFADCAKLNILKPAKTPRATESIEGMIALIETLLDKGYAYKADDGIYFSISKFPTYGQLTDLAKNTELVSRVKNDEYDKENPQDFALWKFRTEADGDVFWPAPFGEGRPGWHIECSAMSKANIGEHFDIHTGGIDLVFPHHTNEIAQSEAASGEKFVNYWLHSGHILVDNKKMSKSLGNFYQLSDLTEKNINPLAYRFWLLMAHYRTTTNFTWEAISSAQKGYDSLLSTLSDLAGKAEERPGQVSETYKNKFTEALGDDLNTSVALSVLNEMLKDQNLSPEDKLATALDFDKVLGLSFSSATEAVAIPAEVLALANQREEARQKSDYAEADNLRSQIEALGYTVKDTDSGPKISKIR